MIYNIRPELSKLLMILIALSACDQEPITPPPTPPPPITHMAAADIIHLNALNAMDRNDNKNAQYLPKGGSQWAPVQNAVINVGEKLFTPQSTTAMIQLRSGIRIAMNSETVITFNGISDVTLEQGEIWVARPLSSERQTLNVRSKHANAVFEGGVGSVRFDGAGLSLSLISGSASLEQNSYRLGLSAGEGAVANSDGVNKVHIKDPTSLVSWTKALRDAIASTAIDEAPGPAIAPSGLGSLTARLPGTKVPLPFEIISQLAAVNIQDHMARTRIEQVFKNPTAQVVEGEYRFPLPNGAKLVGYDMEVNGKMMRGEIVERRKGRRIMKKVVQTYLDEMVAKDPALTEWESGNTFKTRIFPIKAHEEKRIVISFLQPLAGTAGEYRYTLPLASSSSDTIPRFQLNADIGHSGGRPSVTTPLYRTTITESGDKIHIDFKAADFVPSADFVVEIQTPTFPETSMATYGSAPSLPATASSWGTTTMGKEGYFMMQLTPELPTTHQETNETDWMLLVDSSMNRSRSELAVESLLTGSFLDLMGPDDRLKVIRFDTFPSVMDDTWRPPSKDLKSKIRVFLSEPAGGATNIEGVLRKAAEQAEIGRPLKMVLITDGAATVGERAPGALANLAARLFPSPNISLCTVGVGASVDTLLLDALAHSVRGRFFSVSTGEDLFTAAIRIIAGMRHPPLERPQLTFDGLAVSNVLPRNLPNLTAGHAFVITGRYRGTGTLRATLSGTVAKEPWQKTYSFDVGPPKSTNTFIPLFHAFNQIDDLTLDGSESAVQQAILVSKRFGIAGRHTSFIVLENDAMYRRFKVDQSVERIAWDANQDVTYEPIEADQESVLESLGKGETMPRFDDSFSSQRGASSSSAPRRAKKTSAKRSRPAAPVFNESKASNLLSGPTKPAAKPSPPQHMKTSFDVKIWRPSATPTPKDMEKAAKLQANVAEIPSSRRARRNLVRHLIRAHMLDQAFTALQDWLAMDRTNPEPHLFAAEIKKLRGDMKGAFRHFGSAVDLKPENKRVLSLMAGYFESRGAFDRAAPFRAALAFLETKPGHAKARYAMVTALMGDLDTARLLTTPLVTPQTSGYHQLKRGIRLEKSLAKAITHLADLGTLPLDFKPFGDSRRGKVSVTLDVDSDAGLELWVKKDRDMFFGGLDDRGVVRIDLTKPGEMSVFSPKGDPGVYRIQVLCTKPSGCAPTSGKVHLKAMDRRRTIPFTIQNNIGRNLAVIQVKKVHYKYHPFWY